MTVRFTKWLVIAFLVSCVSGAFAGFYGLKLLVIIAICNGILFFSGNRSASR